MKKHPAYWFVAPVLLVVGIALGCQSSDEKLPEVVVDRSECAKCRMLISDARFAGLLKTSEYLMFDDLGCMLSYQLNVHPQDLRGSWVRDYYSNTWIETKDAIFYRQDDIKTPMGYGYVGASKRDSEPAATKIAVRLENSTALQEDFKQRFLAAQ